MKWATDFRSHRMKEGNGTWRESPFFLSVGRSPVDEREMHRAPHSGTREWLMKVIVLIYRSVESTLLLIWGFYKVSLNQKGRNPKSNGTKKLTLKAVIKWKVKAQKLSKEKTTRKYKIEGSHKEFCQLTDILNESYPPTSYLRSQFLTRQIESSRRYQLSVFICLLVTKIIQKGIGKTGDWTLVLKCISIPSD